MAGAVLIVIALVIVLPVLFMMLAAGLGFLASWAHTTDAEATHEGSELIDLNT